jgi:hypothetical protein
MKVASYHDKETPPGSTPAAEAMQSELDLRLFHLKTLYDVSRELLGIVDIKLILRQGVKSALDSYANLY